MKVSRRQAVAAGVLAMLGVVALQGVNSFACYEHDLGDFVSSLGFIGIPMLPALVALVTRNPLRTVGASLLFAPWLVFAYYTDCVAEYQGGGASMVYVLVVMGGFPSAVLGALLTGPVLRALGTTVGSA